MIDTSNIKDLAYLSNINNDKIVRVFTGSYNGSACTLRGGVVYVYVIPHGLGRPVFCELLHSDDGGATYADGGQAGPSSIPRIAFSDSTNIYIFHDYVNTGTVNYKVYCSWIDNYDNTNPLVTLQSYTDVKTQFDSRLNYQKIKRSDSLSFNSTSTQSIAHGLTYTPNVKAYFEAFAGEVWPVNDGGASNYFLYDFGNQDECNVSVGGTNLNISYNQNSSGIRKVWTRIYYDR